MAHTDYIPHDTGQFKVWAENLIEKLNTEYATLLNIPDLQMTALDRNYADWREAQGMWDKGEHSPMNLMAKDSTRKRLVMTVRNIVNQFIRYNTDATDEIKADLGLTVPNPEPTPVPVPTDIPGIELETLASFTHVLKVGVTEAGSTKKHYRKPPNGVIGYEVWRAEGANKLSAEGFNFVQLDTNSPTTLRYDLDDVGKEISYRVRWVNTKGEQGPWSAIVTGFVNP
ncbi:MAG: hypothetical protein LBR17_04335 [Bacteroidales bacterium]|jgi:hypothetical protein|nr:hypothetical protein [Bacteroidales bacterium]